MINNNSAGNREPQGNDEFSDSSYEYSPSDAEQPAPSPQPVAPSSRTRRGPAQDLDRTGSGAAAATAAAGDEDANNKGKAKKKWSRVIPNPAAKVQSIAVALAGPDSQRITLYLFLLIGLLHLLFVILACVLSQLDEVGGGCFTYWGYKANCDSTSYTLRTALMSSCPKRRSMLQAGAAFSILSVLTSLSVVVVGWILCSRMRHVIQLNRRRARYNRHLADDDVVEEPVSTSAQGKSTKKRAGTQFQPGLLKWAGVGVVGASLVCELICWAIIAGLYSLRPCEVSGQRELTYGVGFGLGLTAWIVELIVLICFVVLV